MLRTSGFQSWSTPQWLFNYLDCKYHFKLDAAASRRNAKCAKFYDVKTNGLAQPWVSITFCNPPWANPKAWVNKAISELYKGRNSVLILPLLGITAKWYRDSREYVHTTILSPRVAFVGPGKSPNGGVMLLAFGLGNLGALSFLDTALCVDAAIPHEE